MKKALSEWLQRRPARERQWFILLFVLLVLALLWWIAIAPALQTYRASAAAHAKLDAELASMQAMVAQAKRLQAVPVMSASDAQRWLDASVKKLGKLDKVTLIVQGSRVQINFSGVSAAVLANWLADARTTAQLLPVQANWRRATKATNADDNADALWDGTMVLELPSK